MKFPADNRRFNESGQTMTEYAVTMSIITAAIVATIALFSDAIVNRLVNTLNIIMGI